MLPQNQQVEQRQTGTKQKNTKSQRKQNKKPPNQQKTEIHIPAQKDIFIQNTNATLTSTATTA